MAIRGQVEGMRIAHQGKVQWMLRDTIGKVHEIRVKGLCIPKEQVWLFTPQA